MVHGSEDPRVYKFANSIDRPLYINTIRDKSIRSLYAMAQFSYRDYVYLDVTGRNDWSSTLAKGNNSYFYPSVSASVLLSSIFGFSEKAPVVDLLKVRLSWANVGNDTDPYKINNYYTNSAFGGGLIYPTGIVNADLKPEMVESWETGLEAVSSKDASAWISPITTPRAATRFSTLRSIPSRVRRIRSSMPENS